MSPEANPDRRSPLHAAARLAAVALGVGMVARYLPETWGAWRRGCATLLGLKAAMLAADVVAAGGLLWTVRRAWLGEEAEHARGTVAAAVIALFVFLQSGAFFHYSRFAQEEATRSALAQLRAELKAGKPLPAVVPETLLPYYHADSSAVVRGAAPDDAGGWRVDGGQVWVNCTHTDSRGKAWGAY
ncbi:MAG: hypothetical protein KGL53_07635 [Elusimicrobia bacterium]|nr:hypothetical protein [Elusimicrobiota bacterium]